MRVWPSAGLFVAFVVSACGNDGLPTGGLGHIGSGDGVHAATLASPDGHPAIDAPDMVKVGEMVTVSFPVLKYGCEEDVGTVVANTETSVTVTPLNRSTFGANPCPTFIAFATRSASVSFIAPGVDTLRVVGYLEMPDGSRTLGSLQKTVQVSP